MKIVVLDMTYKFMESFEGRYKDGMLVYVRGQKGFGWFKFGGTKEQIEFDYEKTIDFGKERLAMYKWNGKDYIQISFKDTFSNSAMVDYKDQWVKAQMIEEMILKPPLENAWLKYGIPLAAIAIVITAIVFIYSAQHALAAVQSIVTQTPITNISQQNAKILNYLVSNYNSTKARDVQVTNMVQNLSVYLQHH